MNLPCHKLSTLQGGFHSLRVQVARSVSAYYPAVVLYGLFGRLLAPTFMVPTSNSTQRQVVFRCTKQINPQARTCCTDTAISGARFFHNRSLVMNRIAHKAPLSLFFIFCATASSRSIALSIKFPLLIQLVLRGSDSLRSLSIWSQKGLRDHRRTLHFYQSLHAILAGLYKFMFATGKIRVVKQNVKGASTLHIIAFVETGFLNLFLNFKTNLHVGSFRPTPRCFTSNSFTM